MNKYVNICGKTHNFWFKNDSYNANGRDRQDIVMTSYHLLLGCSYQQGCNPGRCSQQNVLEYLWQDWSQCLSNCWSAEKWETKKRRLQYK